MFEVETTADKYQTFGLRATAIYVVLLVGGIPLLAFFNVILLQPLKLNELGDFFAGAFGPLAIGWLVLGFLQQSQELRLQIRELRLSVEQQRELAESNKISVDAQNRRWISETSVEISKLATDCEELIINLGDAFPRVEGSRKAVMAARGMLQSGAMKNFEEEIKEQSVLFNSEQRKYHAIALRRQDAIENPTAQNVSDLYQLRAKLTTISGRLKNYLADDKIAREDLTAKKKPD